MRRVRNRTFSRFPHISAQPVVFRTFSHNLELPAQFCIFSSIKTKNLSKNWVRLSLDIWGEFRQFGEFRQKLGSVSTIRVSLDKNWVQFRQLG